MATWDPHPKLLAQNWVGFVATLRPPVAPGIAAPAPLPQNPKRRRERKKEMGKGRELELLAWEDLEVLIPNRELILWREHGLTSQSLCLTSNIKWLGLQA